MKTPNIQNSISPNNEIISNKKPQDLEERLNNYFIKVIQLCKKCPSNPITIRIIPQLIADGGSLPANYAEATEAMSRKDFVKSIKICRKEAKEAKVWVRGLKEAVNIKEYEADFNYLAQEATEFIYIFTSIINKIDKK